MLYKLLTTAIMGLCSSFFCWADTVHLKNGDNLSGKIKLVDDNKLLIETEYGGVITINSSKIETFSIDEPVKIKQGLFSKQQYVDAIKTAPNHQVTIVKDGESETITINNDLTITNNKPDSLVASDWIINGRLNAGAYYNKGASKSEQYSFNGRVALKYDLWRHGIKGAIFRAKNDKGTSNYYYTTQYDVDRFFTPSFFWQGNLQYKHDWTEKIKTKMSMGTGPGWQVWKNDLSALSFTGLINYQEIKYRKGDSSSHPLGSIKWSYHQFFFGQSLKFFTTGQVGRSFNNDVELDLSTTTGLAYRLTDWLSINTSLTRDKSTTKDGDSSNTNYNIGAGVNW